MRIHADKQAVRQGTSQDHMQFVLIVMLVESICALRLLSRCPSTAQCRTICLTNAMEKNTAGKYRSTSDRSRLVTYEMARRPHHIGVSKSWMTWHTQNLEDFRQQQPIAVAQDEVIRRFVRGFFPRNLVAHGTELVIKRRGNVVYVTGFLQYQERLDSRRMYWMFGFVEEFLSLLLKQPVKLELQFVESEQLVAYNYI